MTRMLFPALLPLSSCPKYLAGERGREAPAASPEERA